MNFKSKTILLAMLLALPVLGAQAGDKKTAAGSEISERNPLATKVSVRLKDAPLPALLDSISSQAKISFIIKESAVREKLNASFSETPASDVLKIMAEKYNFRIEQLGGSNTYLILPPTEKSGGTGRLERKTVDRAYRAVILKMSTKKLYFVKEGDKVDILSTFEAIMKNEGKQKTTATLLQDVLVLSVTRGEKPSDPGMLEIEVKPNEAQYALLASYQGELDVVTRGKGDTEMHPMEMASFRKLIVGGDSESESKHETAKDSSTEN